MSPFTSDGRLSASALRQLARHAGGALGELPSAGLSTYANDTSVIPVSVTPDLPAWVKVTSTTTQTVVFGGGTVSAYPGLLTAFQTSPSPAGWNDTTTVVWLYPANGEVPVLNDRYPCLLLGTDTSGEQVWGTVPASGSSPYGLDAATCERAISAQSIATATFTKFDFTDSTLNSVPVGANPAVLEKNGAKLQIAVAGNYLISGQLTWNPSPGAVNATFYGHLSILGGTSETLGTQQYVGSIVNVEGGSTSLWMPWCAQVVETVPAHTEIECKVFQNSGGSLNAGVSVSAVRLS